MRIVIKIGTNLITQKNHLLNDDFIRGMTSQIAALHKKNHEIVLTTSGAIAAGRSEIFFEREGEDIPYKQVLAAVGQSILMHTYREYFKKKNIVIAQALLTSTDFASKQSSLNTKNTLNILLKKKAIPIVNENDVTAYDEIKRGDNDTLSARVAAMINADYLIILTTADGLMTDLPGSPNAKLIPIVKKITPALRKLAKGPQDENSRGGMTTKLDAAIYALRAGCSVLIANGNTPNVLEKALGDKKPGTFFPAGRQTGLK